jgi:hypothetical protein
MDSQLKLRDDVISLLDGPIFPERSNRGRPTTSLDKKEEKLGLAYEKKAVLRKIRAEKWNQKFKADKEVK